ncbi:ATP-binding protein [Umezawaea sp. NPDC059074]|uniref:ATP-binding protein n=1 Tax=Umezawaea sp. NPDC059074 TaxID=3346716 RepID=UPI0036A00E3A
MVDADPKTRSWPTITARPPGVATTPPTPPRSAIGSTAYQPVADSKTNVLVAMPVTRYDLVVVRDRVRKSLYWCDQDVVQDISLVTTELLSNAVDHARPPCRVTITGYVPCDSDAAVLLGRGEVVIEVSDSSHDLVPLIGSSTAGPYRGRGICLVQALSRSWGVSLSDDTKTVWAAMCLS